MCTVCPSIIVFHYATREANQKKQDQGDLINFDTILTTILAFGFQWFDRYDPVDEIAEIVSHRSENVTFLENPHGSSRENFKILDTTWPPAPRIVWWKIVSSGSHVWPRGQLIWDLCSSRQSTDWREFFFLPSPILLSHPLHEGLLFQT